MLVGCWFCGFTSSFGLFFEPSRRARTFLPNARWPRRHTTYVRTLAAGCGRRLAARATTERGINDVLGVMIAASALYASAVLVTRMAKV